MNNLYFNNILSKGKENQLQFEYVKSKDISQNFNMCYLLINKLWKELYQDKDLVYKILKYAKKEELMDSHINIFFMQNFYNDLLSDSKELPYELYYIIQKLLNDLLNDVKKISDYSESFEKSNLAYLLDGIILNERIRSFFNLILADIIEHYENSEESANKLLFKVEDLEILLIAQEEAIRKECLKTNKAELSKLRQRQKSIVNKIYMMRLRNYGDISFNDAFLDSDLIDNLDKYSKNNDLFARNYLPELDKNDMIEILNKETNEIMKNYIRNQLSSMGNDKNIYSNKKFLENIGKSTQCEVLLYYYQKNFMITINIIKKIIKKLNQNIEIIPDEIKMICIMMMESLKNKFNWISNIEIYKYISKYFTR